MALSRSDVDSCCCGFNGKLHFLQGKRGGVFVEKTVVLCILPVGIMTGLITLKTGSVWPAAFLHAAHNNYDQSVFSVITAGADQMYFVSETGVLTIVCAWISAAVMYICLRKKLQNL